MNMNPKQAAKATNDALALLNVMSDPNEFKKMLCEYQNKIIELDSKGFEIKRLSGIVDTLAEAEQIKSEAQDEKDRADHYSDEMRNAANIRADEAQDVIDEKLLNLRNKEAELERQLGPIKTENEQRTASLDERERAISRAEQNNTAKEQELDRREGELAKKVEKAQTLFS